jgi:hypothetical protein
MNQDFKKGFMWGAAIADAAWVTVIIVACIFLPALL